MREREFNSKIHQKVKDVEYVPSEDAFGNIMKRAEKPFWYSVFRKKNFILSGLFLMVSGTLVYNIMPQFFQDMDSKPLVATYTMTRQNTNAYSASVVAKPRINQSEKESTLKQDIGIRMSDKLHANHLVENARITPQNVEIATKNITIDNQQIISATEKPLEAIDVLEARAISEEYSKSHILDIKQLSHPTAQVRGSQTKIRVMGQMGYAGALYRSKINNEPLKQALKVLNGNGFTQSFLTVGANYEYQGKGKNMAFYAGISYDRLELDILKYQIESAVNSTNDPLFRSAGKLEGQAAVVSKTISLPIGLKWYPLESTNWKLGFSTGGFVSYNADNVNNLWKNQDDQISYLANKSDFRSLNMGLTTGASLEYRLNKLITISFESQFGLNFWNTYKSSYLYRQNRYFGTTGLGLAFTL